MRFAFVEEHRKRMPVDRLCQVLGVTARGYRAWRRRPISRRQRDDMVLLAHIREQHHLSLGSYGRPRMTQELKEIGLFVGHRRVGRLMRDNRIYVVRTHKYKATTDSHHRFNIAPNVLDRNFTAHRRTASTIPTVPFTVCKQTVAGQRAVNIAPTTIKSDYVNWASQYPLSAFVNKRLPGSE